MAACKLSTFAQVRISRQGAKAQRLWAVGKLLALTAFACFAALRETLFVLDAKTKESRVNEFRLALQQQAPRYEVELRENEIARLCDCYQLLLEWNPRVHLVAPCSPNEFATRHVLESLLLLPHLPPNARVADVGSGAGLPIIPVLIARPDVRATLIESSKKKSVFLREVLHLTETSDQATVLAERFENVPAPVVDCVTCRALDRFAMLFPKLIRWSPQPSRLLLFGGEELRKQIERAGFEYESIHIPDSARRVLFVIQAQATSRS
jgi:16S rRNA (guanine527-N7)-methyltransferase